MVPVEELPQEEDLNGDAMIKDEGGFRSDAGVSSTAVSPKPIPVHQQNRFLGKVEKLRKT